MPDKPDKTEPPATLEELFHPDCRLRLADLAELGIQIDMNAGHAYRLVSPHHTRRVYFPQWLSQLIEQAHRDGVRTAQADMRRAMGVTKS